MHFPTENALSCRNMHGAYLILSETSFTAQHIRIYQCHYEKCLTLYAAEEGFRGRFLALFLPFSRARHNPEPRNEV